MKNEIRPIFFMFLVAEGDEDGTRRVASAADTIEILHTGPVDLNVGRGVSLGQLGAGALAGSVDGHADPVGEAEVLGNDDADVGTALVVVLGAAGVELEPGTSELTDAGFGDGTSTAGNTTLGVGVEGETLGTGGGDREVESRVPETIDETSGADLVEGGASIGGIATSAGELGGVVVEVEVTAVDLHDVAAPVAGGTRVTLIGDVVSRGTLRGAGAELLLHSRAGA